MARQGQEDRLLLMLLRWTMSDESAVRLSTVKLNFMQHLLFRNNHHLFEK